MTIWWPDYCDSNQEILGLACQLAVANTFYGSLNFAQTASWLALAVRHRKIAFAYNEIDTPMAFVTWAQLAPDVVWRFRQFGRLMIHESEWSEGLETFVIDFVAPHGRTVAVARALKSTLFPGEEVKLFRWDRKADVRSLR